MSFDTKRSYAGLKSRCGFSLIELMVVLAIIGMLAAAVTIQVTRARETSRVSIAEVEITKIVEGLEMYNTSTGDYPTDEQGLDVLLQRLDGLDPILKKKGELNDPWGNAYMYRTIRNGDAAFEVLSSGIDEIAGTSDDISSLIEQNN